VNLALFGGTFDPIHAGHLAAARAAKRRFRLDQVLLIPSGNPPHKIPDRLTDYAHRYAMVALACSRAPGFVSSTIEAPTADGSPRYSIDTVRAVRRKLGPADTLYFLLGVDAFLDLPLWKSSRRLLGLAQFIVVSRPGFDARAIREAIPPDLLAEDLPHRGNTIRLRQGVIHLLCGVDAPVASHDIRRAVQSGQPVTGLVPPLVEEYILKEGLYRPRPGGGRS
jgi:nicotinate-nucleotide adenylyltransferase